MNHVLQDLWHDLRSKRLLPVAAALLLGIVAIPAVLAKSAAPPPAPVAAPAPADAGGDALVELHTDNAGASGRGSSLDVLVERNPFRPPRSVTSGGDAATTASAAGASSTSADDDGAGGQDGRGSGGGSGDTPGGDGGSAPSPAPAPAPAPTTTAYEYVADVTFWNGNRRRAIEGLRKLDMLPSRDAPVLIFMGAGAKGGNAVFLVDSTLRAAGEGRCVPGPANCAFVRIGPGSEHAFTTEAGDSYRLRIDEIRRVKLGGRAAGRAARPGDDGAEARVSSREPRRFALPRLTDLLEVTAIAEQGPSDDRPTSR